jgi:hypothetical protein
MPKLEDETLNDDQDETLNDDVETTEVVDETDKDESEQDEEDDSQDEGEPDDSEEEDEDEPDFEKAFKNIKGDTPQEYAKNLEEAYRKSSQEGKLNYQKAKENQDRIDRIAAAVANNPDLAKAINKASDNTDNPIVDPAVSFARQQMESQMDKEYASFSEVHPELDSDPTLQEKVLEEVKIFADAARKKGKILSMEEGLTKAWISLGLDKEDSKDEVVKKAKETASKSKTNNTNKKSTGKAPMLSSEQIEAGRRMGLTEKQMLEALKKN